MDQLVNLCLEKNKFGPINFNWFGLNQILDFLYVTQIKLN